MRKTLLATLVLGAIAAPAMAENSVTIYGQANAAFEVADNGGHDTGASKNSHVTNFRVDAGSNMETPSRLGFKGVETLGDDLNAWFQVETTLAMQDPNNNAASSSTQLGDREAWVGLQGASWGKVGMGHGKSVYVNLADKEDSLVIAANNLAIYNVNKSYVGNGYLNDANGVVTKRPANSLRYDSPVWGGFSFATQYGFGENKTATTPASGSFSIAANWSNDMFFFGAAYQSDNNLGVSATTTNGVTTYAPGPNITTNNGVSGNKQNAALFLGTVKLASLTLGLSGQIATTDLALTSTSPVTEVKRDAFGGWATYAMGPWLFKAGMIDFTDAKVNGATQSGSADFRYSVGANYNFSKQTFGFIEVSGDHNHGQIASLDTTAAKGTMVDNMTPTWLSIGLSHSF